MLPIILSSRKSGKTRHMPLCTKTGNFTRADITVYTCHCGYYCKSSGGLQQHQESGKNCRDRTISKSSNESSSAIFECVCGKVVSTNQALSSHKRSCVQALGASANSSSSSMAVSLEPSIPEVPEPTSQSLEPSTDDLTCCGQTFKNKTALASHRRSKKHRNTSQSSQPFSSQPSLSLPSSSQSFGSTHSNLELQISSDTSQASSVVPSTTSSSSTVVYKVLRINNIPFLF